MKDVKVTLKRKEVSDQELDLNNDLKKQKPHKPSIVRSRINADKEIWDKVTILNEDCRTSGIISRLEPNFKKADTLAAYLCSPFTDYLSTDYMDLGWGCGYRNCQMLMSFLERQTEDGEPILKCVLDIASIQLLIEKAWEEGFDTLGAAQLGYQVFKTHKWIGTTEVYTLFAYLGIRSTIIDFHRPGPNHLHHDLMDWIQSYFMEEDNKEIVCITNKPPLYLQHQGHSRTVVGIEILKSGKRNLIMFDPGRRVLRSYRSSNKQEEEEEVVEIKQTNEQEEEEEEVDILSNDDDDNDAKSLKKRVIAVQNMNHLPSGLLRPFRVDDKTIGKHKQYQILVLGQVNYQDGNMVWDSKKSFLLNEDERESMKNVTSLTVI
ncbi:peptidase family C78-domain-containing protein [Cokeromyces recurvatus]|uniref:peptidase family C78-domain-containing protein n=1 Tax=Cokeromyces recurvatus TaxID=90255 RepID=UPI00221EDFC8|nr:peptidase family C78-domain-containing protein [Cokeromyces recurvatus]KAI7901034.1 peptidase family C78-domain-containing protein [Cokeromyces recurvatus]